MDLGAEWLVEASGCDAEALGDPRVLEGLFRRIIEELDLHPLHETAMHVFPPPGGVTAFVMLTESHLACHTYPEHGVIALNLYCCRIREEWPWQERLAEILGAQIVRVRSLMRGPSA
jgi:S-adenosylmethionine decarboxylase